MRKVLRIRWVVVVASIHMNELHFQRPLSPSPSFSLFSLFYLCLSLPSLIHQNRSPADTTEQMSQIPKTKTFPIVF